MDDHAPLPKPPPDGDELAHAAIFGFIGGALLFIVLLQLYDAFSPFLEWCYGCAFWVYPGMIASAIYGAVWNVNRRKAGDELWGRVIFGAFIGLFVGYYPVPIWCSRHEDAASKWFALVPIAGAIIGAGGVWWYYQRKQS